MKSLNITKLKLTATASVRLNELGLSLGDLNLIICFGRKLPCNQLTLYIFDQKQLAAVDEQLSYLVGTILIVSASRIIDVCRDSQSPGKTTKSKAAERLDTDDT